LLVGICFYVTTSRHRIKTIHFGKGIHLEAMRLITGRVDAKLVEPDAATILQIQASMLLHPSFEAAAADFATRLAGLFAADRVCIGFIADGYARIIAVSHGAAVDPRQELNSRIAAAMDEAIDQATSIGYPAPDGQPRITVAHAELVRRHGGSVSSVPIAAFGRIEGAVTLERFEGAPFRVQEIASCEELVHMAAPVLLLKRDSELPWSARASRALRSAISRLTGKGELRLKLIAGAVMLALVTLFLIPLPYHVTAPVRLEGAVQRALVAAYDGYVQQVAVRPGDAVKEGQVLAELAQQDLQLERSKVESELAQHDGAYNAALAQADRAMLVVHQAKADQARSRLELIAKQLERARIKAPFDGIVISGDLTQSLGAPVQRGGLLMVVAPHDRYRLIVEVDERDISEVVVGASGSIALAALPDQAISFRTERVAPVAIARDGRHFFEVEGKLNSASNVIRPGLEGVAKIDAEARPLASALGHRFWIWLRLSLWSLGWWQ
jgi:multidrug efflux pump subunit AcrA (membrane-fusion protein)